MLSCIVQVASSDDVVCPRRSDLITVPRMLENELALARALVEDALPSASPIPANADESPTVPSSPVELPYIPLVKDPSDVRLL